MDRQKIERSIKGLSEWQMHVQAESDIDTNISTAIEALKAQLSREGTTSDQHVATDTNVGNKISKFIDGLEEIFADLREKHVDDSVCGLCEYDGAYIGQSGDWCNECPGFEKDDCFKLSDKTRKKWTEEIITICKHVGNNSEIPNSSDCISRQAAVDAADKIIERDTSGNNAVVNAMIAWSEYIKALPPAQPELDLETLIRTIETGITATNSNDAYSLGMRNGMRWCKSLIDGVEPQFEDVTDTAELLSAQHEPQEGHWIPHESPDGGVQYECSECGVLWEFNDGSPEDNEAYFCPKCGAKMKGADT